MALPELHDKQIMDMCELANEYGFQSLKESLATVLASRLTIDNCYTMLKSAKMCYSDGLESACIKFIDRNSSKLLSHESFKKLPQDMLCDFLKRDIFYAPEIDIFNAVRIWYANNPKADSNVS